MEVQRLLAKQEAEAWTIIEKAIRTASDLRDWDELQHWHRVRLRYHRLRAIERSQRKAM